MLIVSGVRSFGLVPNAMLLPIKTVASRLATVSVAGLGLGIGVVAHAGLRRTAAVTLSLILLAASAWS